MYLSSPASTRLALGPGRAVLILGPAVSVLVVIGILLKQSLVVVYESLARLVAFRHFLRDARWSHQRGLRPEKKLHREDWN